MDIIYTKTFDEPTYNINEILRYMGSKNDNDTSVNLAKECIEKCKGQFLYKVCYGEFSVSADGEIVAFPFTNVKSKNLADNLKNCSKAIIFAATVGIGIDRLIIGSTKLSPSKALAFQAIGAERIEGLCDMFNCMIADEYSKINLYTRPRFSPGYGDLPLTMQKDIFRVLNCPAKIGLTLNDSMLMSPSKSVTAIIGLSADKSPFSNHKCSLCKNSDCQFREN